ncbi:hypothetical protein BGW41_005623 [Actinomortierella wolfii]|nr:hypothetical protein BGW41_005623 [Actinomortierella wolfii]
MRIFKNQPTKHEACAAEYISYMWQSSSPTPTVEDYRHFMHNTNPKAPEAGIARTWNKMKNFFTGADLDVLSEIQDLINVDSLAAAFTAAPLLPETTSSAADASALSSLEEPPRAASQSSSSRTTSARSRHTKPSISNSTDSKSSGSSGSSGGSGGLLSPTTIIKMRTLFQRNFADFRGEAWKLPSGAILDDLLASHIMSLPYESSLHSFVMEDVKGVLQLVTDENDRAYLETMLVDRPDEGLPTLSGPEKAFIMQYNMPPDELWNLFRTSGWSAIADSLDEKPDEDFQRLVHTSLLNLLTIYQEVQMEVPTDSTESWYTHMLWYFIGRVFNVPDILKYHSGEVQSSASGHRRNNARTRDGRQAVGHKADGIVVTKVKRFEICAIETAKKDNGPNGTKALDDTRKLAKMTKDMHDRIREVATVDIRRDLVTFGVRISALNLILYTMRQRPGRFYQLCAEKPLSLPDMWTKQGTMAVLVVLQRLLVFRKAMVEMGLRVPVWVIGDGEGNGAGIQKDWRTATLTSPHLIPDDITAAEVVHKLDLP